VKKLFSALVFATLFLCGAAQAATQWTYQYSGLSYWGGNTVNATATVSFNDAVGATLSSTGAPQIGTMATWPGAVTQFDIVLTNPEEGDHRGTVTSRNGEIQAYSVVTALPGAGVGQGYSSIVYGIVAEAVDQNGHDTIIDPVLGRLNNVYLSYLPRPVLSPNLGVMPDLRNWNQVVLGFNWDGGSQANFVGMVGTPVITDLTVPTSPVDEPHPGMLLAGGLAALGFLGRRRQAARSV